MSDKVVEEKRYESVFSSDSKFVELFDSILQESSHATAFYTQLVWLYTREYLSNKQIDEDLSFFLLDAEGSPLAFCPLYCVEGDRGKEFSSPGVNCGYLRGPLFRAGLSEQELESAARWVWQQVRDLASKKQVNRYIVAAEPDREDIKPKWNVMLETQGNYDNQDTYVQLIDLSMDEVKLKSELRNSYKPLINKAKRTLKPVIVDSYNWSHELCEKYRKLHLAAVGFATRPSKTFEMMYEMIQKDQAYLVGIANEEDDWLGAFMFYRFHGKGFYASSALSPSVSNRDGVGHLGLWEGMLYAKSRGDAYVNLGWQPTETDESADDKVRNIAFFKRGFGGVQAHWYRGIKKL